MRRLERTARLVATDWGLSLGQPFTLSSHAFVAPIDASHVLKVVAPDDPEAAMEAAALELWAGDGAVRLLRVDHSRRALLLERAIPGDDLSVVDEAEARTIASDVARRLWRPLSGPFPRIADEVPRWLDRASQTTSVGRNLLSLAREIYAEVRPRHETLVHGDLHHHNILRSSRGWLGIDPKPMMGEPEFDVAPLLWNPLGRAMTREAADQWIATFTDIGLSEERLRAWALIRGAYLRTDPDEIVVIQGLAT
jgi:streptomycin 6-kinase